MRSDPNWSEHIKEAIVFSAIIIGASIGGCWEYAFKWIDSVETEANAALPVPMPADGSVRRFARPDDWNVKSMNFASITPSTNFEAADLMGPTPDPRVERHGEILRAWAEHRIVGPHECCGDVVAWNGLRMVAEFMRGAK